MRLTLPEPPSINRYWRHVGARVLLSREGRLWKEGARVRAMAARLKPLHGPVAVTLTWYRSRRAGDLDNRVKIVLDCLKGFAYGDDAQVVELHAYRHEDKADPRVEIEITHHREEIGG